MAKETYRYLAFRQKEILLGPCSNVYIYMHYTCNVYIMRMYIHSQRIYDRVSIDWL